MITISLGSLKFWGTTGTSEEVKAGTEEKVENNKTIAMPTEAELSKFVDSIMYVLARVNNRDSISMNLPTKIMVGLLTNPKFEKQFSSMLRDIRGVRKFEYRESYSKVVLGIR